MEEDVRALEARMEREVGELIYQKLVPILESQKLETKLSKEGKLFTRSIVQSIAGACLFLLQTESMWDLRSGGGK